MNYWQKKALYDTLNGVRPTTVPAEPVKPLKKGVSMSKRKPLLEKAAIAGEVFWGAGLFEESKMSGKYEYDLCNLSDKAVALLEPLGVTIKDKGDERGKFITSKSIYPIRTQDANGMAWDQDVLIGNGSKASASIDVISLENSFGHFVMVQTNKLQINELVAYEPSDEEPDIIQEAV